MHLTLKGFKFIKGETWIEQRRFTLRTLRDFGYGESMEDMISQEVEEVNNTVDPKIISAFVQWFVFYFFSVQIQFREHVYLV